jgi:crossover junction endodeoxyribonuclease RuvC
LKLHDRYHILNEALEELMDRFKPEVVVVETQYVSRAYPNVQSTIKLAMARMIPILLAKKRKLSLVEYAPQKAKQAVVGNGKASKGQVQSMVQILLKLAKVPPEDAADALALAICFAHQREVLCTPI